MDKILPEHQTQCIVSTSRFEVHGAQSGLLPESKFIQCISTDSHYFLLSFNFQTNYTIKSFFLINLKSNIVSNCNLANNNVAWWFLR